MNIFKKLFSKLIPNSSNTEIPIIPSKNLNTIAQFDDVWVNINGIICEGWVIKKENGIIDIVYTNPELKLMEISFKIGRPLDKDFLKQGDKILYLSKEAAGIQ